MIDYSELKRLAEAAAQTRPTFGAGIAPRQAFRDAANPTAVLALIAELERQAAQFKEWQASHHRNYCLVADERDQLKAEVEALRKDADRYRWLAAHSFDIQGSTQFHVWQHIWGPHSQTGEPAEWKQRVRGPAIARFIDAAMSKEASHD